MSELLLCKDCGQLVRPKTVEEYVGERGRGGWQCWDECPACGGDDLAEWKECSRCRKPMQTNGEEICQKCMDEIEQAERDRVAESDDNDKWILDAWQRILEG